MIQDVTPILSGNHDTVWIAAIAALPAVLAWISTLRGNRIVKDVKATGEDTHRMVNGAAELREERYAALEERYNDLVKRVTEMEELLAAIPNQAITDARREVDATHDAVKGKAGA